MPAYGTIIGKLGSGDREVAIHQEFNSGQVGWKDF